MINITKQGKFIIPENECFIGYAGDNLNTTKEIFVEGIADMSLIYRMYLQFDDGTCNYFLLESEVQEGGTLLIWNVTSDQIFKSGIVKVQIKASNDSGEVFHSSITNMLVQTSVEFSDYFCTKENSEFLQYENTLTQLKKQLDTSCANLAVATAQAQDLLNQLRFAEIDNEPVENSDRLVKSGGVYSALATKMNYSATVTVDDITDFDSMSELNCIYDVIINGGVIPQIEYVNMGKVFNIINFQFLIINDGRLFSRYLGQEVEFNQIGYTKEEIINFVKEAMASLKG